MGDSRLVHHAGALAALVLLAGCATTSARMLDDRTAMISGAGSAFTSMSSLTASVVQKAALEGRDRGFPYFVVMDSQNRTSTSYVRTPSTTNTDFDGSTTCMGVFCNTSGTATSTTTGGGLVGFDKPQADMMVRYYREGEVDPTHPSVWTVANVRHYVANAPRRLRKHSAP